MIHHLKIVLIISFFLTGGQSLLAQIKSIPIDMNFETLNSKNGLSQGFVSCIMQDQDGFMWFATNDGLNKFDGYKMKVYRTNPIDNSSIPTNSISQIAEDKFGNFWVGTRSKGLLLFDKRKEAFYALGKQIDSNSLGNDILQMACHDSLLMVRSAEDYCIYNVGPLRVFKKLFSFKEKLKESIFKTIKPEHRPDYNWTFWMRDQSIWRIYGDSVYCLRPNLNYTHWNLSVHSIKDLGMDKQIGIYLFDGEDNHSIICVGSNALTVYDCQQNKIVFKQKYSDKGAPKESYWYNKPFEFKKGKIMFCNLEGYSMFDASTRLFKKYKSLNTGMFSGPGHCTDRDGNMWIGTGGYGCYKYNTRIEQFNTLKEEVNSFYEDEKGNIHIAFKDSGAHILRLPFKVKEPIGKHPLFGTYKYNISLYGIDKNNNKWFYILYKGNYKYNPSTNQLINVDKIWPDSAISFGYLYFFFDRDNSIWQLCYRPDNKRMLVHSNSTTLEMIGKYILPIPPDLQSQTSFFTSHYQDTKGNLWFGSINGLWRFNEAKKEWKQFKNNLKDSNSISSNSILGICEDPKQPTQYLWIGTTDNGFFRFEMATGKCKRYNTKNGLPNNVVYGLLSDDFGNLWLSTNQGLSCFNIESKSFRNYNPEDGLPGNEYNSGQYYKSKKGMMFFGGVDGLTFFEPKEILSHVLPENKIVFTNFLLFNKPIDFKKGRTVLQEPIQYTKTISLPARENMFTIEFALLYYGAPEKKEYQYWLEGFNKTWIENGILNSATFTNLDAGTYTFHVKGKNSDGVWNKEGASLIIIIKAPWYRTWWFRSLLFAFILGSLYAFYRYRLFQLQKVNIMRNLIASDLHDEIGSTISSISVYSEIIEDRADSNELKYIAEKINRSSRDILVVMSDIVWSINPKNDRFDNVILRMKSIANEIGEIQKREIHFDVDEKLNDLKLEMNDRKNFYLIFKEAFNNSIKYAEAKNIWIRISFIDKEILLVIKDDGIGFESSKENEGNGIQNMTRRANDLNGTILIMSTLNIGTEIKLQFPI